MVQTQPEPQETSPLEVDLRRVIGSWAADNWPVPASIHEFIDDCAVGRWGMLRGGSVECDMERFIVPRFSLFSASCLPQVEKLYTVMSFHCAMSTLKPANHTGTESTESIGPNKPLLSVVSTEYFFPSDRKVANPGHL